MKPLSTLAGSRNRDGFTLIESIIYVALASIVLVSLLNVMLMVLGTREATRNITDLHYSARFTLDRIRRTGESAQKINIAASKFNSNSGALSLAMSGASRNPTVFSLSGSRVYIREASGARIPLTPETVVVDQLRFSNLTATGAHATVQVLLHAREAATSVSIIPKQTLIRTSITLHQ